MRLAWLLTLAACVPQTHGDVVGPFTGDTQRFVVDTMQLPHSSIEAHDFAGDLDGDGMLDNQLGQAIGTLLGQNDGNAFVPDLIASGALASIVLVQATDFSDDPRVGVTYLGADGEPATTLGGTFTGGVFVSNRAAVTHVPGKTQLHIPVFADADPTVVELDAMELTLTPDGRGGYEASIHGAILADNAFTAITPGLRQMIDANPGRHSDLVRLLDVSDGEISEADIRISSIIKSLLTPDLKMFDSGAYHPRAGATLRDSLSLGFAVHLMPCPAGNCALATPVHTCNDRVLDGDETDRDCGGSCLPCPAAAACAVPTDCQTRACTAGACAAPTCTDGIQDGYEHAIDCGSSCACM